ncbi:MAG: hypothetical protein FWF50_04120 [Defluviitaleaceae bacterium]|nr:hypothetical protein [Defluviitaleaceae bacterium]
MSKYKNQTYEEKSKANSITNKIDSYEKDKTSFDSTNVNIHSENNTLGPTVYETLNEVQTSKTHI